MSETNLVEEIAPPVKRKGDLTQGPILRTLLQFSIPMLFSNMLQTIGGTINTIWVGQLLGESALAATANANMVIILGIATTFGFAMAATVRVGQYFGARDLDNARRTFGTGVGFCLAIVIGGASLGWIFADPLLRLMATPPAIHDDAVVYLRVSFLSLPFSGLAIIVGMGLRGVGDARSPLYAMILTTIAGIALNPLLILGIGPFPKLGIAGSALALTLSSVIGALALVGWAYWRKLPLCLRGRELAYLLPAGEPLDYILRKGVPMGAQMLLNTSAALVMVGLVNREGMMTTAAYGAMLQVWAYVQMPSFAISVAVSAMVAQNIGASLHDRVRAITVAGVATNTAITLTMTGLLIAFDRPLLALFLGEGSPAIVIAERIQLLATWALVITGTVMVLGGTMRAYGAVLLPLLAMAIALWPLRLAFYELTYPLIGADALWWSFTFGAAVSLLLTWLAFIRPGWRRDQIAPTGALAAAE